MYRPAKNEAKPEQIFGMDSRRRERERVVGVVIRFGVGWAGWLIGGLELGGLVGWLVECIEAKRRDWVVPPHRLYYGICLGFTRHSHVGVNAPGTPNRMPFFPANTSRIETAVFGLASSRNGSYTSIAGSSSPTAATAAPTWRASKRN